MGNWEERSEFDRTLLEYRSPGSRVFKSKVVASLAVLSILLLVFFWVRSDRLELRIKNNMNNLERQISSLEE
jgi:hypothetical protein